MLNTPTSEQLEALQKIFLDKKSVVIQAAPGSGKTFFFLNACLESCIPRFYVKERTADHQTNPNWCTPKTIIVSYNKALKDETTKKLAALQEEYKQMCPDLFESVGVLTYHGLISHYSKQIVSNDLDMRTVLFGMRSGELEVRHSKWDEVELLLLDESQDMRLDYCQLVLFLIKERFVSRDLRIALVGDERQLLYSMYAVNYADARFLSMAPQYFA
jgi:superfamily II DNA or RNA helicase